MWIKKLPGIVANAAVLILNVFAILMIVGLFLHQGTTGERVKETITRFFFHDVAGVLSGGRGIQPEERPG